MFICKSCGNETIKWQGQCPFCKEWNTLEEFKEEKFLGNIGNSKGEVKNISNLNEISYSEKNEKIITKSNELNNVLGGGIVPGGVVLLSGEPGIGKSTITLQLANLVNSYPILPLTIPSKEEKEINLHLPKKKEQNSFVPPFSSEEESKIQGHKVLYISGEETIYQIADRAKRLGIKGNNLQLLSETCIEDILETLNKNKTDILIIDSISVMHSKNISGVSGSISQVKFISEVLTTYAKKTNTSVFIIGHVTKDGTLAGPKTMEHMVDVVLYFEGDKYDNLRILRSFKNRFGPTNEIGIFTMTENGLSDLKNPGLEFVNSKENTIGSSLSITIEGTRPLVIETESLTTYTKFGYPKRSARGINASKLDLIVAVLGKYTTIKLDSYDVYSNIARGLKIEEPGIDLSLAVSIISSKNNIAMPKDTIYIGEISLTGKIKKPIHLEKRLKEAEKMGFKRIFVPDCELKSEKIKVVKVRNVGELVERIKS